MYHQNPAHLKLAEKLEILYQRIKCLLNQFYQIKTTILKENSFFYNLKSEQTYDSALKLLIKNYPSIETKNNRVKFECLLKIRDKLIDELNFPYNSLVDVIMFRDSLINLIGEISVSQYSLDINSNFDMTYKYLELISDYASILLLVSENKDDYKLILLLYNFCILEKFSQDDSHYRRLCERFIDKQKDGFIPELYSEMNPFSKTTSLALGSLSGLFVMKLMSTKDWDQKQTFKLKKEPFNETVNIMTESKYVPHCKIERWIIFGYVSIYGEMIKTPSLLAIWKKALENSFILVLHRNLTIKIHKYFIRFFDTVKNGSKLSSIVKEAYRDVPRSIVLHRTRRNYLRLVLRHFLLIILDNPALIAPNFHALYNVLSCCTNELIWYFTHTNKTPSQFVAIKYCPEHLIDDNISQLIHQMMEMRFLIQQFDIVRLYYGKVLVNIDLIELQQYMDSIINDLSESDIEIFNSLIEDIESIDKETEVSFTGARFDWFRMQTFLTHGKSSFDCVKHSSFINFMNTLMLHTNLYDNLDSFLYRYISFDFLLFCRENIAASFMNCLQNPANHRYVFVYTIAAGDFLVSTSDECPEDFNYVLQQSNELVLSYISQSCKQLTKYFQDMLKFTYELDVKLFPQNSLDIFSSRLQKLTGRKLLHNSNVDARNDAKKSTETIALPGSESKLQSLTTDSEHDRTWRKLIELASAFNCRNISINGREFCLAAYLQKDLIKACRDLFSAYSCLKIKRDKSEIIVRRRPSELMVIIKSSMSIICRISEYVNLNPAIIFQNVFLCHSLKKDNNSNETLSSIYTKWYIDLLLSNNTNQQQFLYVPLMNCFLSVPPLNSKDTSNIITKMEEYTDCNELQSLVQIIGPYGIRILTEELMYRATKNLSVLRKFVLRNQATLINLNTSKIDNARVKQVLSHLVDVEEFCENWRQLGIIMSFNSLLLQAINTVSKQSLPFLYTIVEDLQQEFIEDINDNMSSVSEHDETNLKTLKQQLMINDLRIAFGLSTDIDSVLFSQIQTTKREQQQIQNDQSDRNDELTNNLLFIATAYVLPNIVGASLYRVEHQAIDNNSHCIAYAIKNLMYVLFAGSGQESIYKAANEFLARASSYLLGLGMSLGGTSNTAGAAATGSGGLTKDHFRNRDSIYLLFDFIIQQLIPANLITVDFYEKCFPYALVRQAYHNLAKLAAANTITSTSNVTAGVSGQINATSTPSAGLVHSNSIEKQEN